MKEFRKWFFFAFAAFFELIIVQIQFSLDFWFDRSFFFCLLCYFHRSLDCLNLLSINIGAQESEGLWKDFYTVLNELLEKSQNQRECSHVSGFVTNHRSKGEKFREISKKKKKVVESLSLLCFIGNQDEKQTIEICDKIFDILQKRVNPADKKSLEADYIHSLLSNWLFLLTSVSTSHVYDKVVPK